MGMQKVFRVMSLSLAMTACVSMSKYKVLQEELERSELQTKSVRHQADSLRLDLQVYKADLNSLDYELGETQKFAAFSDMDLAQSLKREQQEKEALALEIESGRSRERFAQWLGGVRAEAFADEAKCIFSGFTTRNIVLVQQNTVLLDLEEVMRASKDQSNELKAAMLQLTGLVKQRGDWKINVCLGLVSANADWHKVTLQNEMIGFLVEEASLPTNRIAGVTHLLSERKLQEVQWNQIGSSHLYLEVAFSV